MPADRPQPDTGTLRRPWPARLPFYYGWVIIALAFVTIGLGVNARTAFTVLFPPILDDFGWSRGATAAAFSVGFGVSALCAPLFGVAFDRFGPRVVVPLGGLSVGLGLMLTAQITTPWQLYLAYGVLVVGGGVTISYIGHAAFLPRWFARRRGFAIGIAFAGVGVGALILLPGLQALIGAVGWRESCLAFGVLVVVGIIPANLILQRHGPGQIGLQPDGGRADDATDTRAADHARDTIVDPAWANRDWTLGAALGTARFWWLALGMFSALYAWYAVQVHQNRFLIDVGFSADTAAWALGLVGLTGVAGQIGVGALSDRFGREWAWTAACLGYVLCYGALLALPAAPHGALVGLVAASQGLLGYGIAPLYAAIPSELFQGRHYGAIFGCVSLSATLGGATGPWASGQLFDHQGTYATAWTVAGGFALLSVLCIWMAAPRKVRRVAGRVSRT